MAIDPALLAALTSGASTGAKSTSTVSSSTGIDWGSAQKKNQPGAWSLGQSIIDILSTGGYATAGITNKVGQNVAAIQRGELGGLLDLLNPLSVIPAAGKGVAERRTYSQNLRELGVEDKTATWLGLALDIGLDPTTYITGGTLAGAKGVGAGVRLASAANKANATVLKSATEAAANNLPAAKAFIPADAPLTQGQKLGNYLTGVLRGYEFNKSAYAAERANTKLAKVIQKDAAKSGKKTVSKEILGPLEAYKKSTNVSIADDIAVLRRDEFMQAVSRSKVLQAKFGSKIAKAQAKAAKEADYRFFDAKTAAKDNEKRLAEAAKANQMQKATELNTAPAAATDEAIAATRPPILEQVEGELVAENAAAIKKLTGQVGRATKAYQANLKAETQQFNDISKKVLDFVARNTDPATGKRWSEVLKDSPNKLEAVADLLATGKIKLSANTTASFARTLGVSSDPQQSIVDLTVKTILRTEPLAKLKGDEYALQQMSLQLSRMIESAGINANTANGAATAGMVDAAQVGAKVEEKLDLEQEVANRVNDSINKEFFDTASDAAKTPEEIAEGVSSLKVLPAEQFAEDFSFLQDPKFDSRTKNLLVLFQDFMEAGPYKTIAARAKAENKEIKDVLKELAEEAKRGNVNEIMDVRENAVRVDMLNAEARIPAYNKLVNEIRFNEGKKGRTAVDLLEEESRILRPFENYWRLFNVPVVTPENLLMQLKRDGQKNVGDKLSPNFKPMSMDYTMADLGVMAIKKGFGETMAALRYPGKSYQNVMPTNFEYAMLTAVRYKELGADLSKGSEAWLEIRKAFDQNYTLPRNEEGVIAIPKKAAVDSFFKPARHLNPVPTKSGMKLKKISNLEQKSENMIQFMVDNLDEIIDTSSTRAAARYANATQETLEATTKVIAGMVSFVAAKKSFLRGLPIFADVPQSSVLAGVTDPVTLAKLDGLDTVKDSLKTLILSTAKTAKVFTDPVLAKEASDMMLNMFFKSIIGGTARGPIDNLDPADADELRKFVGQHWAELRREVELEVDLFDAMGSAKPSAKATPKAAQKGADARRRKNTQKGDEVAGLVPNVVKAMDDRLEAEVKAAEQAPPIGDEASNVSTNLVAANVDPISAGIENIAIAKIKAITDPGFVQNWLIKFSGRYGMGLATKVIIGGIEYFNQSKVGLFNNGLKNLFLKHNKDLPAINAAFKFVQSYGRDMIQRLEDVGDEIPYSEWVKTANTDGVNLEIAESFNEAISAMFGVNGVVKNSITLPYYGAELNRMFDMRGFFDIGEGAFRLADDAGPMAVKYSWAAADVDEKFTSLTFLSNYASAIHAVQTRIGIGESFSSFFGKSLDTIKKEGLRESDYVKIDPEDEFAKYLNPDVLYDASELERLRYVKEYVLYPKSFSSKSMQKIVDISDRITSVLKAAHTTWRPGHHVTSIVGEAIMNAFAGVNSPKYYGNALDILREFDPSIYKADSNSFKAYAEIGAPKNLKVSDEKFDKIGYINSKTGKRVVVSKAAVAYMCDQLGIFTRGGASTVEDLDLRGMADFQSGLIGGATRANSKLAEFSSHRDNIFRVAHFIKEIEKGGVYASFEEAAIAAAKRVTTYHPTIGGLSAFERKVMRRAVFFYTWQRIAATKVAQLVLEQPGKITIPSKIQYAFAESNGFNPESFGDPWDPDGVYASWNTGSTFGPQFQGPAGKGDAWGFGPAIPQLDIMNSLFGGFTVQPGQSGLDVLTRGTQNLAGQNLSPLPKWFAELSTGNRVGTGGNINNYLEYAIDQVGGLNTLSKVTGIGQDPETGLTPTEQAERKTRLLANWFLGQKLQDYSTSQTIRQWNTDQRLMMQRLTGQE
jgi:hypothetical protein